MNTHTLNKVNLNEWGYLIWSLCSLITHGTSINLHLTGITGKFWLILSLVCIRLSNLALRIIPKLCKFRVSNTTLQLPFCFPRWLIYITMSFSFPVETIKSECRNTLFFIKIRKIDLILSVLIFSTMTQALLETCIIHFVRSIFHF